MRGSRFVGMVSIKKVSVPGSSRLAECEQPRSPKAAANATIAAARRRSGESARTRIANLAEHRWPLRAGRRGKIVRASTKRLVSQNRKSKRFIGLARNSEFIRRAYRDAEKQSRKLRHHQRIPRAAAGNNQFAHSRARKHKALQRFSDRQRSEKRRRADHIVRSRPVPVSPRNDLARKSIAELLAPRSLRRPLVNIMMRLQFLQKLWLQFSPNRELRIAIERRPSARKMPHQSINNHIPRSSIESDHFFRASAGRNHGDIRNPANIQCHAANPGVAINHVVHEWNQRRTLPTGRDVRGTKISNGVDSSARSNHRRLADLQRGRDGGGAKKVRWFSLVVNRLSMRTDHRDFRRIHAEFLQRSQHGAPV